MKSQRAWRTAVIAIVAVMAGVSTAQGQLHHTPGFHPAADPGATHPYAIMMGQEFYDPTWIGATDYGDTCCGPNWYDFLIEGVWMTREDAGRNVLLSSDGIAGPIVLETADLDFQHEPGLRAFARYQVNAVYNLEAGYLGVVDWDSFAGASSSTDSLYSAFSQFGVNPFGGFDDVDQAALHRINLRADLDSVEINLRRSWTGPRHRIFGSCLAGVRYVNWRERFQFFADVQQHVDPIGMVVRGPAQFDYQVLADNDLVGFQLGSELGVCLLPGLNVTAEFKAGIYGNRASQDTTISSTSIAPPLVEAADTEDAALVSEAGAYLIYQIHPLMKLRAGYQALFLDGIALAAENFNSQPPFAGSRTVSINDNGNAFAHGGLFGMEIGW